MIFASLLIVHCIFSQGFTCYSPLSDPLTHSLTFDRSSLFAPVDVRSSRRWPPTETFSSRRPSARTCRAHGVKDVQFESTKTFGVGFEEEALGVTDERQEEEHNIYFTRHFVLCWHAVARYFQIFGLGGPCLHSMPNSWVSGGELWQPGPDRDLEWDMGKTELVYLSMIRSMCLRVHACLLHTGM